MGRTQWGIVHLKDGTVMHHILPSVDDSELDHPTFYRSDSTFIRIPIIDREHPHDFHARVTAAVALSLSGATS